MTIWGQALYLSATIHSTLGCGVGGHEQVDRSSYKRREKNHRSHRHSGGETDHADIKSLSRAICSNFQNGDWFAPRPVERLKMPSLRSRQALAFRPTEVGSRDSRPTSVIELWHLGF